MRKGRLKRSSPRKREMSPSRNRSPAFTVSSSSRSPSPLGRPGTPAAYLTTGQKCYGDAASESDAGTCSESPGGQDGISISPGVRYITESLIKKVSKQENLGRIITLNLSLAKDGGRKFKYIENLEKCDKLEVLNLSNNLIEKIEKLDRLLKLCDLNLSHNKISKIEGIEHLHNLQKLNLAGNEIEHIPAWMGKKLRSLRILNLRKNRISSLQELAKLKPLKDLTSLFLADNPVVNLPHYRLYTIFHLRSLEDLDGQPVTNCDREEALERFNLEEIENLEKVLEKTMKEVEDLKAQQTDLLEQLKQQDDQNKSLREKHLQQKATCKDLESELGTKNELLKQKTVELTRACQKQYELEQELAFYKIDAKFEPLGYYPAEDVELDNIPGESPYIGKARYKRNMYAVEGYIPNKAQKIQVGNLGQEEQEINQKLKLNLLQSLDGQLEEKEKKIKEAQEELAKLHSEVANAEQRILKATEELTQVQGAAAQKKMSEVEKDCLRQQLSNKILLLNQLRQEALELEKEIERQKDAMAKKEKELETLQSFVDSLDPTDPSHAHAKAQRASKDQQLDMMSKHYKHLETRLDDILSRIAKETEEIRDLEQQLTDGQIAANDALKRDLEGIIVGLQEYLESVKDQAKQTSDECKELRKDKAMLLQKLEAMEHDRNHLEIVAMDAENLRKDVADLEHALQEQRELNEALRENQAELSAYGAELEAELKAQDAEANQHKEDLEKIKQLSQLENSSLRAELGKGKQALEDALTKAQLLKDRELENDELLSQLKQLQKDNNLLKQQLRDTESQLNQALDTLIHPEEVLARVNELKQKLQSDAEIRCRSPNDILGKILADLLKQFREILTQSQHENKAVQARERALQKEMAKMEEAQEKYRQACEKAAETKVKSEKKQNEARVRQLENEILHLREKLRAMEEIQHLSDQQLQEADEEKERILVQLEDLENRKKVEDAKAQIQLLSIDKELRELKRAVAASDKQATADLCAAKDQLRSLHGTVQKINQERSEELQEAEKFCAEAAQATQDIAKAEAEIELLQKLLEEKEKQFQYEMEKADAEIAASDFQKEEIERLNLLLKSQKREIERLLKALAQAGAGSREEIESILNEITALKNAILHQNDTIAGILDPLKQKGHLYYMPPSSQASTPASQGTKDSGVGLQCHTSTPVEKRHREGNQSKKGPSVFPSPTECWLHGPVRNGPQEPPLRGENQEDGEVNTHGATSFVPPSGSVIYTLLPDGVPTSQGPVVNAPSSVLANREQLPSSALIYGSVPAGIPLVYANCSVPLVPVGVLHCNIPEHHNLENQVSKLQERIDKLNSQRHQSKRLGPSHHEHNKEMKELHQGIQELWSEREELEHQISELRKIAQKRKKRKDFVDGHLGSFISELELENSFQHHDNIMDEIVCIEKTLLKRRAELREADRLLAEAEHELENTRIKTKDTVQKYSNAKKNLTETEKEAEELERRAQEMALQLVKTDQQLRLLHADTKDLEQHKMEQEGILKEINKVVCAKDSEFQSLSQKIEILTESLQKLQMDIQVAEGNEDHHLQILKEAESILQSKKSELERLNDQIAAQHKELIILDRLLSQKKEELHLLQNSLVQTKADLSEALRDGEAEVTEKQQQIKEVKSFLEDLSVQKGELNAQLSERRAQHSLVVQDIQKEQEKLQDILGQIIKHKTELKHIWEMLRLENAELDGIKLQHSQKVDELEKLQTAVLEEKLELENLQRLSHQQRGDAERQRQLIEKTQQEAEQLNSQFHFLQNGIQTLSREKRQLEESCESLEKKLSEAKRTLIGTEDNNKATQTTIEKMSLEVQKLQLETECLEKHKIALNGDIATLQKQLHEKKEELNLLKTELNDSRRDLQSLEQDVKCATKQKERLAQEQVILEANINEYSKKCTEWKEAQRKKENLLQKLCREIEEQEMQRAKQELILQRLREDTEHEEKKLEDCTAKLKDQKQLLEQELAEQRSHLERVMARIQGAEEQILKLQEEESWCATLEETIGKARHQLSEKEVKLQEKVSEVLSLQRELELLKMKESALQDQVQAERKNTEKQILGLREAIRTQKDQLERALHEQKQENHSLQKEVASIERVAKDNQLRAKKLMGELIQIQDEYMQLKSQMKSRDDLEKRQKELKGTVKTLKLEVKDRIRNGVKDLSQSPELFQDLETTSAARGRFQSDLESLKENYPFTDNEGRMLYCDEKLDLSKVQITDEQWRGQARREHLQHQEDRLKAQLRHCMSKQVEVLIKGKQETEGTLHSLKKQVDALGELVSSTSADSTFPSVNSSWLSDSLHEELSTANRQFARSPCRTGTDFSAPSEITHL